MPRNKRSLQSAIQSRGEIPRCRRQQKITEPLQTNPQDDAIVRAARLLSRSGKWDAGIEDRVAELQAVVRARLKVTVLQRDLTTVFARSLAWMELDEEFRQEWMEVKKLLRREENILPSTIARLKGITSPVQMPLEARLKELRKYVSHMQRGPRGTEAKTKPILYDRENTLWNMDEQLIHSRGKKRSPYERSQIMSRVLKASQSPTLRLSPHSILIILNRRAKRFRP